MRKMDSPLAISIVYGKKDSVFYTTKEDRYITAIAGYYNKKVKTERLIVVGGTKVKPTATPISKVTILS